VLPLGGRLGGESFGKGGCLMTKYFASGADKGCEMMMLFQASLKVFSFLLLPLCLDHFLWISVLVQLGVSVSDSDIEYDAVSVFGPETLQEDVSLVIFSGRCFVGAFG
jgi:hypothetical protein